MYKVGAGYQGKAEGMQCKCVSPGREASGHDEVKTCHRASNEIRCFFPG